MGTVVAFGPKRRRRQAALPGRVVWLGFYDERGTQRLDSIDAAVGAIRAALESGCTDLCVGVRPLPPDELEPEHER